MIDWICSEKLQFNRLDIKYIINTYTNPTDAPFIIPFFVTLLFPITLPVKMLIPVITIIVGVIVSSVISVNVKITAYIINKTIVNNNATPTPKHICFIVLFAIFSIFDSSY